GERAQSRARGALPPEQRRTVLCGPGRVRRVPEAARRQPGRGGRLGTEWPRLRAPQLPVGRRPGKRRADLSEGQGQARIEAGNRNGGIAGLQNARIAELADRKIERAGAGYFSPTTAAVEGIPVRTASG